MTPEAAFDAEAYAAGRPQLVWTRLISDLETPVSAFLKAAAGRPYAGLLESVEGGAFRGRYSILFLQPDLVWRCRGGRAEVSGGGDLPAGRFRPEPDGALPSLKRLVAGSRIAIPPGLPPMAAGLFGAFGYDMARLVERLPEPKADPLDLPDAVLTRPSVVAVFDALKQEIVLVTPVRPGPEPAEAAAAAAGERLDAVRRALAAPPPVRTEASEQEIVFTSGMGRDAYLQAVERARAYIAAGDVFQVVPSQRFSAPLPYPSQAFYRALRRLNPSPYLFHLDLGGFQLAGSSPEILIRLREGRITLRPLAGTRRRGATPEEDAALERELLADPKERAEHLMLLDLGRNDVGRFAAPGSVRVTESFAVERYSHVMHIVSNVTGQLKSGLDALDALASIFPAGTLSGAPKVRAMEIIDELEPLKRGIYGGAIGYLGWDGNMDTAIAIRTAVIKGGQVHVQAGAGIVADSDPRSEWEETMNKAAAMLRAAAAVAAR